MLVRPTRRGNIRRRTRHRRSIFVDVDSSGLAALALINTHAAAAVGLVTWIVIDAIRGNVSISGACLGPIIGLVAVTPACGFIQPGWALLIGFITTGIVYGLLLLKRYMRVDDTLDVATVHGCGR
jgi:ammonium transporter, Amt family